MSTVEETDIDADIVPSKSKRVSLGTIRDAVLILGVLVLCALSALTLNEQARLRRAEEARRKAAENLVQRLEVMYRKNVFEAADNKGVLDQIFRQNEVLIEYEKGSLKTSNSASDAQ